jgi:hypothetical protein
MTKVEPLRGDETEPPASSPRFCRPPEHCVVPREPVRRLHIPVRYSAIAAISLSETDFIRHQPAPLPLTRRAGFGAGDNPVSSVAPA